MTDNLISGKDQTERIVSVEMNGDRVKLYSESECGIKVEERPAKYWALFNTSVSPDCLRLDGNQHFKYAKTYTDEKSRQQDVFKSSRKEGVDSFVLWNPKEMFMVRSGVTYYKGMTPKDVSILAFDIETTSLVPSDNDKILLISNTYRDANGNIERRLFKHDNYKTTKEMVYAWCHYVRDKDPSILCGHHIFGFDLPYLDFYVGGLCLGRDGSDARFAKNTSEFRKEGGQTYSYKNVAICGREVVDTFHLSIRYDAGARRYESYKLKTIIRAEGLEKSDREFYDASLIRQNYKNPVEWEKIIKYCIHDGDDALALFDLMIPPFFYFTQSVPKSLQQVINGASGSQVNSWMLRAYIQDGHSVPKASDSTEFIGAISFGIPGVYKNVKKVDVASLYPSIILQYNVCDKSKDPKEYFLKMVKSFTEARLENKRLSKETGESKYRDLEQSQKIFINSAYGFMGASGLNFNSPKHAAFITNKGREILETGIDWAKSKGYEVINGDTDSFCYVGGNDFDAEIKDLNNQFPDMIRWENDGEYKGVLIVKAKNYALETEEGVKIKGSGLKATMKEPALTALINRTIHSLLGGNTNGIINDYNTLALAIGNIDSDSIKEWASKKTVTKSVLDPKRTNESRVLDAIKGKGLVEGDKCFMFFETDITLRCVEDFNGTYDKDTLYAKLFKTIKIFDSVLDISLFPNYSLKRNKSRIPSCPAILYSQGRMEAV